QAISGANQTCSCCVRVASHTPPRSCIEVIWIFLSTAAIGVAIGAFFRIPALLVATAVIATGNVAAHVLGGGGLHASVAYSTFLLLLTLQVVYLIGLLLSFIVARLRS